MLSAINSLAASIWTSLSVSLILSPVAESIIGEALENRKRFGARARRAPAVDCRVRVGIAKRHAAEYELAGRDAEKGGHGLVPMRPGFLGAGIKPIGPRKQHDRLDIHAEIGPLRWPHRAIDQKKQANRCIEELEISRVLAVARRPVFTRNAEGLVEQRADLRSAGVVWLFQGRWVDRVFRPFRARQLIEPRTKERLERRKRGAGENMHGGPGLQVASRGRTRGAVEDLTHRL